MGASKNLMSSIFTSRTPTVKSLQTILQQIGGATSGRKEALQGRILHAVKSPATLTPKKETKILSIDMGIRNLAYCVATVSSPSSLDAERPATMDILAWRRLDLTEEAWKHSNSSTTSPSTLPSDDAEGANEEAAQEASEEDQDLFSPKNLSSTAFSLVRALLRHEPDIILIERQRWRSSGSSAIQQWTVRVNSLEAMLWAMFTAVRDTPTAGSSTRKEDVTVKYTVCSVDPKRVGNYWLDSMGMNTAPPLSPPKKTSKKRSSKSSTSSSETPDIIDINLESDSTSSTTTTTAKAPPRAKAEKKAKINILRTWLDSASPSTALPSNQQNSPEESKDKQPLLSRPDIRFHFTRKSKSNNGHTTATETSEEDEEDPVTACDTLLRTTQPSAPAAKKTKAKKGENSDSPTASKALKSAKERKVDDITDCFLQAAAYVAWQMSLGELKRVVARADAEGGGHGGGEEGKKVAKPKPKPKRVTRKTKAV